MIVDVGAMAEVAGELCVPMVVSEHGDAGGQAVRAVLAAVRHLYWHVAPEACQGEVLVFKALQDEGHPLIAQAPTQVAPMEQLEPDTTQDFTIEVRGNGQYALWIGDQMGPDELSASAVVYRYRDGVEQFIANGRRKTIPKFSQTYGSALALPTFSHLSEALARYSRDMVRLSSCYVFDGAWFDKRRLFFSNKPEATMRRSLYQYLRDVLRNAEVRQEQNVSETEPVDLKVTWLGTTRLSIIEIKWLGDSLNADGTAISLRYRDARAKEGAEQLAKYLDANAIQAPGHMTRGYLVVIDGRRSHLNADTEVVGMDDALHYRDRDIVFDPAYHELREDFEAPIRMFSEPVYEVG